MKLFISYSTADGFEPARKARGILKQAGHDPWFWEHNSTLGGFTWREISESIMACDAILYLCTASSGGSWGQIQESGIALNNRKKILVVQLDNAPVPTELTARNYASCQTQDFADQLTRLAPQLPEQVGNRLSGDNLKEATLDTAHTIRQEQRDRIRRLNKRRSSLDTDRVSLAEKIIMESYLKATIVRNVTQFAEELAPDYSTFQTIEVRDMLRLTDFNDSHTLWNGYFSDVGRALAAAEQKYLQEAIGRQIGPEADSISRSDPDFDVLERCVTTLSGCELPPNVLFVPVEMFARLVKRYGRQIDAGGAQRIVMSGAPLRVVWSHRFAPSSCFTVFSSRAGTWRLVPDDDTRRAISLTVGQSELYPDYVEIGVETVVRYDVAEPRAFSRIELS